MRQVAQVRTSRDETVRLMLFDDGQSCSMLYFDTPADGPGTADTRHETIAGAKAFCADCFGIMEADWQTVADPEDGCQHDIIEPTRAEHGRGGELVYRAVT